MNYSNQELENAIILSSQAIEKSLELSETCWEGITYIETKLKEKGLSSTVVMLNDVIQGIHAMQVSIEKIKVIFPQESFVQLNLLQLDELRNKLNDTLHLLVELYNKKNKNKATNVISNQLKAEYETWVKQIQFLNHVLKNSNSR